MKKILLLLCGLGVSGCAGALPEADYLVGASTPVDAATQSASTASPTLIDGYTPRAPQRKPDNWREQNDRLSPANGASQGGHNHAH